jgi:PhoPQ-activated pathogenicity-related protein
MRKSLLLVVLLIPALSLDYSFGKEPVVAPRETDARLPSAIFDYVAKPEPEYSWKLRRNNDTPLGHLYEIAMRSQTWQNITWEHSLIIHEPKDVVCQDYMLLFVTGGRNGRPPGNGDHAMGFALAKMTGARVAMLYQVPNQPLFDNRYEDDLITETWLRYLESGDDSWPLLFPMVKSAVKAMDTLEAVANERWQTKLNGFVITGASKRGWTSWLTPVVDKRVVATAPMVIDVLNFRPQMKHQLDVWGTYSDQIHDYSSKGLIKQDDESPREMKLRLMMDPYTYRSVLKLPKLLVNGTNDQYWVVDAMKLYWPDLEGPKFVLQVPNAGHGLGGGGDRVGATVAAFFRHVVQGRELPKISWKALEDDSNFGLQLDVEPNPRQVTFWRAHSSSGDFRESRWSSVPMDKNASGYVGQVAKPAQGEHVAFFGEMEFEADGQSYWLSTLIQRH